MQSYFPINCIYSTVHTVHFKISRTRRNSGIPSSIDRPDEEIYDVEHCYYYGLDHSTTQSNAGTGDSSQGSTWSPGSSTSTSAQGSSTTTAGESGGATTTDSAPQSVAAPTALLASCVAVIMHQIYA